VEGEGWGVGRGSLTVDWGLCLGLAGTFGGGRRREKARKGQEAISEPITSLGMRRV
jgi:hypothetical protein